MNQQIPGTLLLFSALAFGQQQEQIPYSVAPYGLDRNPATQMPPETKAPPPEELSPAGVQLRIQEELGRALSGVDVTVNEDSVILFGSVDSPQDHDLVLQIATSYAGGRKIIDQIEIRGRI